MTDDFEARVQTSLNRLEDGLIKLEASQTLLHTRVRTLGVDLMARMDRLQNRMDLLDEHLTMGLGHAADAAWKLLNLKVETSLKAEQHRWEPWKVMAAAFTAGAGTFAAAVAVITLLLHLAGKL